MDAYLTSSWHLEKGMISKRVCNLEFAQKGISLHRIKAGSSLYPRQDDPTQPNFIPDSTWLKKLTKPHQVNYKFLTKDFFTLKWHFVTPFWSDSDLKIKKSGQDLNNFFLNLLSWNFRFWLNPVLCRTDHPLK